MSPGSKFFAMFVAIAAFLAVMGVVLLVADRVRSRRGEIVQTVAFILPAAALIAVGLLYPGLRTIYESFKNQGSTAFVGLENYQTIFTSSDPVSYTHLTLPTICSV